MANNFFKTRNGISVGSLAAAPSAPVNGDVYYDTTLKKFQKYENGVWGALGGGGSGSGKNYLTAYTASTSSGVPNTGNGDLEFGSTSGFSLGHVTLTSNFPSGVPTFGSGASGNLSLSAISSSQLAGLYSLGYVSSAATTAGDFVATDAFFVDKEDQAKMMTFSFAYNAFANPTNGNFSGTSSNSFAVAIYDVTNSVWIQPAGVFNLIQNAGVGICTGTFQTTSNSTQYRLVVYNANATSGAITMYFDDFIVGPQVIQKGPAVSNDVNRTSDFTINGFGTTTENDIWVARVGNRAIISGHFLMGTAAASTASISLPADLKFDANSTTSTGTSGRFVGTAWFTPNAGPSTIGSSNFVGTGFYDGSDNTKIFITNAVGSNTFTKVNGTAFSNNNSRVYFQFEYPVVGWDSNSVMSNDTDTRVVAFAASTASGQAISTSPTLVTTWSVLADTHAAYSGGTYTVPVAGYYFVDATTTVNSATTTVANTEIWQNGVVKAAQSYYNNNNVFPDPHVSVMLKCVAGDTIQIKSSNSDGVGLRADATKNIVAIFRLSGPAVVATTESVNCKYYLSANSTPGASLPINFDTKLWDSHGAVTTGASWKFTAPVSGKYHVDLVLAKAGATASDVNVYKNGVSDCAIAYYPTGTDFQTGSTVVSMNAGDTIDIRGSGNSTYAGSASVNTHVSIFRIGN